MKLHDLKPAAGSKKERMRVGRGIAAGKGKTAGRGTKGQKSRAGGTIPPFFEGGQTPLHIRIPKLHGFKNRGRIEFQVVNVGRLSAYADAGRFQDAAGTATERKSKGPQTVNPELLRATGLISSMRIPVKILGQGDVTRALFVVADAFTASAREKLEAAGGTAQLLVVPDRPTPALRLDGAEAATAPTERPARRPRASELAAAAAKTPAGKAAAARADAAPAEKTKQTSVKSRPPKATAEAPAAGEATTDKPETKGGRVPKASISTAGVAPTEPETAPEPEATAAAPDAEAPVAEADKPEAAAPAAEAKPASTRRSTKRPPADPSAD